MKRVLLTVIVIFLSAFVLNVTKVQALQTDDERIAGTDRYNTSIEISKFGWTAPTDTAIIATGEDFPDALSAAPLASLYKAPILLTNPNKLNSNLYDELIRLKVKKAFIIGGTGVISKDVEKQLTSKGITCTRVYGNNRYETSVAVANQIGKANRVVLATGDEFPDALSIASWAASAGVPILLTDKNKIPDSVAQYIKSNNISQVYVIGGKAVIDDSVLSSLPNPKRIQGNNRYETNLAVLKEFENEFNFNRIYFATGNDFPDALSGSVLASITKSPIVLLDLKSLSNTKTYLETKKDKITEAYIMGGENVVPYSVFEGVMPTIIAKINITLQNSTIAMNDQAKPVIDITMIPKTASKPSATYMISDSSIASIGQDGTIIALKPGSAKITVSAGGKSSSIDINVILNKKIVLDPGHGGSDYGAIPTDENGSQLVQYREAALNLSIAQKIEKKLKDIGASVTMTRENDTYVSPSQRVSIANGMNADLFLSIHHNSVGYSSAQGTETHYSDFRENIDLTDVYAVAYGSSSVYDDKGNVIGTLVDGQKYKVVNANEGDIYINYNGKTAKTTIYNVIVYDDTPSEAAKGSKVLADAISDGISSLGLIKRQTQNDNLYVTRMTNMTSVLIEVGFLSNPYERQLLIQDSFQDKVADKIVEAIVKFYSNQGSGSSGQPGIPATP